MYNSDTELLFPVRVIPFLAGSRNEEWKKLVESLAEADPASVEVAGFVLLMVRLGGCAGCNADSFRAMKGCTICARQTVRRYRGSDQDMVDLFRQTVHEMEQHIIKRSLTY